MHKKFGKDRACACEDILADRQTHRQTGIIITILRQSSCGRSNKKKNLSQEPISLESPVRVLVDEGRPAKKCKWELYTVKQQGVKDDGAMEGENGGSTNEDDLACATMDMSAIER